MLEGRTENKASFKKIDITEIESNLKIIYYISW